MNRRLKVLALSYLFPNRMRREYGIFVLNRLKALGKHVDIKVINPLPWFPFQGRFERYHGYSDIPLCDKLEGVEVYHPRFLTIPKYFKKEEGERYFRAISGLVDNIHEQFEFDLVDMHWTFPDLPAGIRIAQKYDCRSLVTLRGMEALHLESSDPRRSVVAEGLRQVDHIVALSNELKLAGDRLSGDSRKSEVIRNGVDVERFYFIPKAESVVKTSVDATSISILSVGSLIYRKGFDLLIKALARCTNDLPDTNIKLYIIGSQGPEGDYREGLNRLIHDLNVADRVQFVGQVPNDQLVYWYNACDIFCLASRGEGSPNVLTEALATGCPCITTDVGSAKEIIQSIDGLGECVPPDSEIALSEAIESVMSKSYNRADNARRYGKFDWDWCASKVLATYQQLVFV